MMWVLPFLFLLVAVLWGFFTSNLILKVERFPLDFNPKSFGYDFENFTTFTEDQIRIEGWFVPSKKKVNAAIMVLHGWGANRSDVLASTIFLAENFNLVYFDFRNHGRSGGNFTSLTCLEVKDFVSVVNYITAEKKSAADHIGIFGFSMGAAVAITGSAQLPQVQAVVAESPFSSYNQTVCRFAKVLYGIPQFTVPFTLYFVKLRLGFDPEKCSPIYHVSKISPRPLFIIQGGNDLRMPVSEGQALFDAANTPKEIWTIPNADHGGAFENSPEEFKKRIAEFFFRWLGE